MMKIEYVTTRNYWARSHNIVMAFTSSKHLIVPSSHPMNSRGKTGWNVTQRILEPVVGRDLVYSNPPPSYSNNLTAPSSQPIASRLCLGHEAKHQAAPP